MNYIRRRQVPLVLQLMHLKRLYPAGKGQIIRNRLVWLITVRPHALAHAYFCRLEYDYYSYPRMYVINPPLSLLAKGRKLPHVRSRDEPIAMCLFRHDSSCWDPTMSLAEIVIPMAYYWLACFEDWLFSGEWNGGATHEVSFDPPKNRPVFPTDLDLAEVA